MCEMCDALGQWVCCGGSINRKGARCPNCGRTEREDHEYQCDIRGLPYSFDPNTEAWS
jgi:tRNA(Ile2) C34 agmatinyltransferase TiaS